MILRDVTYPAAYGYQGDAAVLSVSWAPLGPVVALERVKLIVSIIQRLLEALPNIVVLRLTAEYDDAEDVVTLTAWLTARDLIQGYEALLTEVQAFLLALPVSVAQEDFVDVEGSGRIEPYPVTEEFWSRIALIVGIAGGVILIWDYVSRRK